MSAPLRTALTKTAEVAIIMSWKHTFANWQVEIDWEGLTLTPLAPKTAERQGQTEKENEPKRRFNCTPAFDAKTATAEGEQQVWV
jgi:hypothetical protein